jgi:hypothetical protein
MFEDTKGVIRIRKSKKVRPYNGQKKKDKRTNNDLQNYLRSRNTHPTKNQRWIQALRYAKQFLRHMWHPSFYYCYKSGDKPWMSKGLGCDYGKRNIYP